MNFLSDFQFIQIHLNMNMLVADHGFLCRNHMTKSLTNKLSINSLMFWLKGYVQGENISICSNINERELQYYEFREIATIAEPRHGCSHERARVGVHSGGFCSNHRRGPHFIRLLWGMFSFRSQLDG